MIPRRRFLGLAAAVLAGCALPGCAADRRGEGVSRQPELLLRYAENQPEDYPTTQAALAFAELVAQRTEGRVKVRVYCGGELGTEQSVIEQMQFGGIDFARVSASQLTELLPQLRLLQLPYLYQDAGQMWRVLDGEIGDGFLALLDSIDLAGLSWYDAGVRRFYTRSRVTCLEELQGLLLRVQESDMMSEMITALGAVPVQTSYGQVYARLYNGAIDGAENNWPSYEMMAHYEVAPFVLLDEHTRVPELQISSCAALEKLAALDEGYPELVRECARESSRIERSLWAQQERRSEENMRARGIEVTALSAQEMEKFRRAVQPLYDNFAEKAALIEQIRST
ncbi:MAG: TRAP transporter substrate-binding protein [Faecalibacterium sp.]